MNAYWNNYVRVIKKYAIFEGKAVRREFWMYVLVHIGFSLLAGIISPTLGLFYGLFSIVPSLAVGARRLHDMGQSGWWLLLGFIPFIGTLALIIMTAQPTYHSA